MNRLPTGPFERNFAVTKLGLTTGTRIVAHNVANLFRSSQERATADRDFYAHEARVMADELGRLKGSIMKAGQMLSLYAQYFLPEEAVRVLSSLQDDTPHVAWSVLSPVLTRALGRRRLSELEIEEEPMAAASLGQVHRARRRRDGLELCLKVQYPGVADAIESDVKTLQRIVAMTRLAPRGLSLEPVFAEVREMLHREVDYLAEREHTETFAARLKDDRRYVVPTVLPEYCSDTVLTTTFEPAQHVKDPAVNALSQERRNRLAEAALDLFLTEFFSWRMVQTDPHFGNYRVRPDADGGDRLLLLDFGATRVFGQGFMEGYRDMVRAALMRDHEAVLRGAAAIGLMQNNFPETVLTAFAELCELFVEPFGETGKPYRWGDSDLPRRVTDKVARNALSRYFRVPPREIVFLHRRLAGVFILLATLRAEIDARPLLLRHLG